MLLTNLPRKGHTCTQTHAYTDTVGLRASKLKSRKRFITYTLKDLNE